METVPVAVDAIGGEKPKAQDDESEPKTHVQTKRARPKRKDITTKEESPKLQAPKRPSPKTRGQFGICLWVSVGLKEAAAEYSRKKEIPLSTLYRKALAKMVGYTGELIVDGRHTPKGQS